MNIIKGFIIAFSMFSKIPMPMVKWEESNMKYVFCFFPFIGIIIGLLELVWYKLAVYSGLSNIVFAGVATLIPVAITGGIHFDGYMDTCDALSSHQDKEKMLEILDDSHVGAFAILSTVIYFIIYFTAMSCVTNIWQVGMLVMVYFVVRAIANCIILSTKLSKEKGLLYTFKNGSNKLIVGLFSACYLLISVGIIESFNIAIGALTVIAMGVATVYFLYSINKKFGGISGDLIGYFICVCELVAVVVVGIGGYLI